MVKIGGAWKFIWKFSGQKQKEQSCQMGGSCMLRFSGEHPKRKIDILFARSLYRKYWCRRLRGWGSMMVWHVHFDFTHRTKRYPLANTLAIRRLPGCVQVTAFARSMANLCKRWRIVSQSLSTAWRLLGSKSSGICQNPSREANYVLCCDSVYWLTGLRRDVEIKTSEPEIADNLIDHPLWEMVLFPGWEMDMEAFAYLISSLPPRMTPEEFLVLCWIHNFWVPAFSMAKSLWSYQMLHYIWVNYNDLTTTSLEIMVSKGNHPQMALIQVSEIL